MTEDEILKRYGRKGKLTHLPAKHEARLEVLAWVAAPFQSGVTYRESEVNDLLAGQEVDHVTLRRYLVDYGFLTRAAGVYQLAPNPPWPPADPHEGVRATQERPHEGVRATQERPHEGVRATQERPHEGVRGAQEGPHEGVRGAQEGPHEGVRGAQEGPHVGVRATREGAAADRFRGCLLGLAAGDAVGTTVEFKGRGSFPPVQDMTGGGPFGLPPGAWTDDTSMALCLATSLVEQGGFDARDQMDRYVRWYHEGYLSSIGRCFDIGNATRAALARFERSGDPLSGSDDPYSAGNGSIMRLAPVPMYFAGDPHAAVAYAVESSRTTHAAPECLDACRLFAAVLLAALAGAGKQTVLFGPHTVLAAGPALSPKLGAIAEGAYRDKEIGEIRGSGYVVQSLEAALWCFWRTDNFRDAILLAANLGDDADTTAAVCGQVAGAFYGQSGIPGHWLKKLAMAEEIRDLADRLMQG